MYSCPLWSVCGFLREKENEEKVKEEGRIRTWHPFWIQLERRSVVCARRSRSEARSNVSVSIFLSFILDFWNLHVHGCVSVMIALCCSWILFWMLWLMLWESLGEVGVLSWHLWSCCHKTEKGTGFLWFMTKWKGWVRLSVFGREICYNCLRWCLEGVGRVWWSVVEGKRK